MIVSILQLMGFPIAKPVNSRAGDGTSDAVQTGPLGGADAIEQENTSSARRPEVKATSKKSGKAASEKTKSSVKSAKAASKSEAKAAVQVSKAAKETKPAKPAKLVKPSKDVKKSQAAKETKEVPVLKVAKPAEKVSASSVAKATAKSPAKVAVKASAKVPAKPAAKPAAKTAVKAAVQATAKSGTKSVAVTRTAIAVKAPAVVKPVPKEPVKISPVLTSVPSPAAAQASRAGRPSSRLAQLTVPSMAQSIASTAAKASYSQSVSSPVIVPALPSSIKKDAKLANNWKTKPVAELTDAELLAMSDDDYMNDVQMAAFRLKLQTLKQDILNNAGETTEHLREDTSVVPDPADRATIEEEHALELRTRDRERKLLKKIEQSIARIDAGDYGYCDETGEPIGVGRLLARPTATLSLEAQQRRELKQKMFGD